MYLLFQVFRYRSADGADSTASFLMNVFPSFSIGICKIFDGFSAVVVSSVTVILDSTAVGSDTEPPTPVIEIFSGACSQVV